MEPTPFADIPHVIQVALTPVFLLSGIGTLLNMFNLRVSRVSDHIEHIHEMVAKADEADLAQLARHTRRLRWRILVLDTAVALGALAGAATCGAAFALFVVTLRDQSGNIVLLALFGAALGCTILALTAFLADSMLAWHGLREDGPMPRPKQAG